MSDRDSKTNTGDGPDGEDGNDLILIASPQVEPNLQTATTGATGGGGGGGDLVMVTITESGASSESGDVSDPPKEPQAPKVRRSWAELASEVMYNELVLAKTAERLPPVTLSKLRETCSLWSVNFLPQVQETHQVNLEWDPDEYQKVVEFIKLLESSVDIPFTNYFCNLLGVNPTILPKFYNFISTFGSIINNLALAWQTSDLPVSQLRNIIFEWTPNVTELILELEATEHTTAAESGNGHQLMTSLPKLTRIKVALGLTVGETAPSRAFTQLICDTIQCTTRLEHLELCNNLDRNDTDEQDFVRKTLTELRNVQQLHKLKTLDVSQLKLGDLQILIQLGGQKNHQLQLHSFTTWINCRPEEDILGAAGGDEEELRETVRLLKNFLVTQSPTLRNLEIQFEPAGDDAVRRIMFEIPKLEHVQNLLITNWALPREEIVFGDTADPGSFLDTFPRLRQFSCDFSSDLNRVFHPGVEELKLGGHLVVAEAGFALFSSIFPSLTRLELGRHQSVAQIVEFSRIWTAWPNLTVLKLEALSGINIDSFLSGVPFPNHEDLMAQLGSFILAPPDDILASLRTLLDTYKTQPGLSDLEQLRKVSIKMDGWTVDPRSEDLTDVGGYFGIALGSRFLQRVEIKSRRESKVSHHCRALIRNTLGLPAELNF